MDFIIADLANWNNFYTMVGSASGALIGLQFVVITLIAQKPKLKAAGETASAFLTPSIMQFGVTLFVSAIFLAPWISERFPLGLLCVAGVVGIGYTGIVAIRMRRQTFYQPHIWDGIFHIALPLVAYAVLAGSLFAVSLYPRETLFGVGAAALLLLFIGIRNAWDNIAYMVFIHGADQE